MPLFISPHGLRSMVKYYERQQEMEVDNSLEQLYHLAYRLKCFITVRLQHVIFALYFALLAQHQRMDDNYDDAAADDDDDCVHAATTTTTASKSSSYGSINSAMTATSKQVNPPAKGTDICISIEACEGTPLLPEYNSWEEDGRQLNIDRQKPTRAVRCMNCRLFSFILIASIAISFAIYMLWREFRIPNSGFKLSLISHGTWSSVALSDQTTLLDVGKVLQVFITHTTSGECGTSDDCLKLLHELQGNTWRRGELPSNFIVAGDCQVYEARGWQYASGLETLPQSTSLVFTFLGDFTQRAAKTCQLQAAHALLRESVKRHKLQPEFMVFGLFNVSRTLDDGASLQRQLTLYLPHYVQLKN